MGKVLVVVLKKTEYFTEFIEYKLQLGTIYTLGNTDKLCGTSMNP